MAESDLHAVDGVDGGVAGGGAAQGSDQGIGDKAHMHQVVLHGFRQIEGHQDPGFADVQFAQHAHRAELRRLRERQHPENYDRNGRISVYDHFWSELQTAGFLCFVRRMA